MKNKKGITLIALVITVIILIILAGVAIYLALGNNGILNKAEQAKNETTKQAATEKMNLKITNMQIETYGKEQRMPTLQEFSDGLCEDDEIQYVELQSKKVGSLSKIEVGEAESIFTKLKEYPYEFEINSSLQLASIDGVKIADNNNDGSITLTQSQYNSILNRLSELENNLNSTTKNENYSTEEQVIGTWIDGKPLYRKVISIDAETSEGMKIYTINIKNVEQINIDESHSYLYNTNTKEILPISNNWDTGSTGGYSLTPNSENIKLLWYRNIWHELPAKITLEYTKTTDSAS